MLSFKPLDIHRFKLRESRLAQMDYRPATFKDLVELSQAAFHYIMVMVLRPWIGSFRGTGYIHQLASL